MAQRIDRGIQLLTLNKHTRVLMEISHQRVLLSMNPVVTALQNTQKWFLFAQILYKDTVFNFYCQAKFFSFDFLKTVW